MKFLRPRFPSKDARNSEAPDSRNAGESRFGLESLFGGLSSMLPAAEGAEEAAEAVQGTYEAREAQARSEKLAIRKQLLRLVLAKTVQKTMVPAAWIGGELNPMVLPNGEEWIEVRLSLQVDEPRFLTYLASFQAEFERRMLAAAPDVREWLAGISWKFTPDAIFELPMPKAEYWEQVQADRLLTARQKGAADWDRESLARHFSDTNPGELVVDFEDTRPPERDAENILGSPKS
jgi:hypothetical protein